MAAISNSHALHVLTSGSPRPGYSGRLHLSGTVNTLHGFTTRDVSVSDMDLVALVADRLLLLSGIPTSLVVDIFCWQSVLGCGNGFAMKSLAFVETVHWAAFSA